MASYAKGGIGAPRSSATRGTHERKTASYVHTLPGAVLESITVCAAPSELRRKRSW